ncbi:MAG: DUF695 domain-containing protein [Pseudomonadota bacterium]|uniref:DUF695 domain-containing protein n=1 Tax=Sphingomonas sp. ERG5 TaxID=1381597 RepID=UPI00068F23D2|nr:DUF695 domain-containing protein [Sphingomonas sp. ERG5]
MPTRNADDWSIATGMVDGNRTIIRVLSALPEADERAERPLLIRVTWTYGETLTGMPDPAALDTIETFEETIFASIDQQDWATEVAAITGNGAKQWRFYTDDGDNFVARFSAALENHPIYPIELEGIPDPEWQGLRELQPG